jgi:hypothetical protein
MKAPEIAVLARAAILLAALTVACLLLAGCVSEGASAGTPRTTTAPAASTASAAAGFSGGSVFGRVLGNPAVTVTSGQLYVAWQVNRASAAVPRFELARADQATGAVEAARALDPGYPGTPLAAGGSLWLTIATAASERLLRMNPADLTVTGELSIGDRSQAGVTGGADDLAAAGGALWVASGDRLLRVSPRTGRVTAVVALPGAYSSGVGASGDVLVVSEANASGLGSVQRRDPETGALIASQSVTGVAAPRIGGVAGSGVWVAEATGMLGYIERFRTATMAPERATEVGGSNGIGVRVADGLVWVTEGVTPRHDYCADPVTGRVLGRISLPDPDRDYVSAIAGRYVYVLSPAPGGAGFYLRRLGVAATCLASARTG